MNKRIKSLILTLASAMGLTFLSGCNFISPNSNNQNNNNNHNSGNIKPTGHTHTFSNYVSDDNATCTEDGTKTAKCDFCDVTNTKQDTRSIKGHSFTHYTSNNDATCTQDGTKTAKCDRCDLTDTQIDTGSKKPHNL